MTPFFRVYAGDSEVSIHDYIDKFEFEDSMERDSMLRIGAFAENAIKLLKEQGVVENAKLRVQFGMLGGDVSEIHVVRVTDLEPTYASTVRLDIVGLDMGNWVKKSCELKVWKGMTSAEIVQAIADKYGLASEIEGGTTVWDSLPQGNKSDFALLKHIADRETDGSYVCYIRGEKIYFVKEKLDEESKVTYTYGADERMLSFKPKYSQSNADPAANNLQGVGVSSGGKEIAKATVGETGRNDDTKLGEGVLDFVHFTNDGEERNAKMSAIVGNRKPKPKKNVVKGGATIGAQTEDNFVDALVKKYMPMPDLGGVEGLNLATGKAKKTVKKVLVATLVVELNPLIRPNTVITIAGVDERYSGNWFVWTAKHSLTNGGTTTCEMGKNAFNKKDKQTKVAGTDGNSPTGNEKVNKTVGGKTMNEEVKMINIDNFGNVKK